MCCWSLPENLEAIHRPAYRDLLKWFWDSSLVTNDWRIPTHLFMILNISRWILHHYCDGGNRPLEGNKYENQGVGECGASPSPKQIFFMFFAAPSVFAIFLSLSVNALNPLFEDRSGSFISLRRKWANESLKEKCTFCQTWGAVIFHRWVSK